MPTSPVGTFTQTNVTTMSAAQYTAGNDGNWAVAARLIDAFAPRPAATPAMSVVVDAGHVFTPTAPTLTEVAAQTVTIAAAPGTGTSRIDRVVVNAASGVASVVTGTAAASPTAPAIPAGCCPVAQVTVAAGTLAIVSTMIADERDLTGLGLLAAITSAQTTATNAVPKSAPITSYYGGTGATGLTIPAGFGIGYLEYNGGTTSTVSLPASAGMLSIVNNNSGSMALYCGGTFVNLGPFGVGTSGASAYLPAGQTALLEWTSSGWNAVGGTAAIGGVLPQTKIGRINTYWIGASGTYTPSAGLIGVMVEVIGGGGGGGGAYSNNGAYTSSAGGGGGGGYARAYLTAAQIGASQTITVGAGGNGGAAGVNNGAAGGTTSFGSFVVATGGSGGGGSNSAVVAGGGPAGAGNTGALQFAGSDGFSGSVGAVGYLYGVSGGSGGSGPAGYGGSTRGPTSNGTGAAGSGVATNGYNATGRGSGGSGGVVCLVSGSAAGGNGGQGGIIVTEFLSA